MAGQNTPFGSTSGTTRKSPPDIGLLRLQYEILGTPINELAAQYGLGASAIQDTATQFGWERWWPNSNIYTRPTAEVELNEFDALVVKPTEQDQMKVQADEYAKMSKLRVSSYELAKQEYLSHKYARLESSLISEASNLIETCTPDASSLRFLGTLLKDLKAAFVGKANASSISIGSDANGRPKVIIQDVRGTNFVKDPEVDE